ncbi:MAG: thioredoxin domain-containing protein [Methanothrix sp.]
MDLKAQVQGFMAKKQELLSDELSEKYGVPPEEVAGVVESFLADTYGPAISLAQAIADKEGVVLLFIGRKDCNICRRSEPILEDFLSRHKDLGLVKLDYSQPSGLLYHMIHNCEKGMLPLIAFIFRGAIRMIFTGECLHAAVYEKYYNEVQAECSQNIYAH